MAKNICRIDGRYDGHIPGITCPAHGGPEIRVFQDGNAWCAVRSDFIDLQQSPAGFGDTKEQAKIALKAELQKQQEKQTRLTAG